MAVRLTTTPARTLAGKVALVTGSGRGIGRAIALRLAADGADVVVNFFRDRGSAEGTAAEARARGVRAHVVKAHVGDPEQLRRLFAEVDKAFGALDVFVANAAQGVFRPALELDAKAWDWTIDTNALAFLLGSQEAAVRMERRGGGSIVALTSIGASRAMPYYAAVGASKAALEALVRSLAFELAPRGIAVNAVAGGVIETDALRHYPEREGLLEWARAHTVSGRLVTPDEIAGVVAWLCTDEARQIRGQTIVVDGGLTLGGFA
ncbi:MAG TPA: enoyl-[acyl-carrier-protein] reductase FabL [Candidatus Limnocylindrales bacterium]|nr:enoyl-[acyl-carrier-protein] reductase FabL [Candidatus Limnocylindrales bacterium]